MYCIKGCDYECDGCGRCTDEGCAICGEKGDTDYYAGVAYCISCAERIIKKRSSK